MPGQLGVSLQPVANSKAYQAQFCIGTAAWQEAGIFPSTKGIIITGLVAGTTYTVRVRAVAAPRNTARGARQSRSWRRK